MYTRLILHFLRFFVALFLISQLISCGLKEQNTQKDIDAMLEAQRAGDTQLLDQKMQAVISRGEIAVPMLIELFDTSQPDQLALIQLVLMRLGEPAEKALIVALSKDRKILTLNALSTLDLLNSESAIPAVTELLSSNYPQVRIKAASFLYKHNRSNGFTVLSTVLQHGDEEERKLAILELIKYPNPETMNTLIKATGDPIDFIKVKAIKGLANLKDPSTEPLLEEIRVSSRAWRVRLAAALAIYKITGNLVPYKNSESKDIFPDPDSEI